MINEVLSYMQNKADIMDEESLVRICSSAFSVEEIDQAKSLLFGCVNKPKTTRKGQGKMSRDLNDIITLIKATDPEELPLFVSRELHKLPPTTFDHVDVTRLLRDIIAVQKELRMIQEKYASEVQYATVSEVEQLKFEIETLKKASAAASSNEGNNEPNVNYKRGAFCVRDSYDYCNSGPIGMTHSANQSMTSNRSFTPPERSTTKQVSSPPVPLPSLSYASITERKSASLAPSPVSESVVRHHHHNTDTTVSAAAAAGQLISTPQYAPKKSSSLSKIGEEEEDGKGEWIRVERRKKRSFNTRFTGRRGKASVDENSKFKAAVNNIPLYIYNVSTETTAAHISDYIMERTKVAVTPEKICMREMKGYDSYKILVPRHRLFLFENDDLWPHDIFFRRYFIFKNRSTKDLQSNNTNLTKNGEQQQEL